MFLWIQFDVLIRIGKRYEVINFYGVNGVIVPGVRKDIEGLADMDIGAKFFLNFTLKTFFNCLTKLNMSAGQLIFPRQKFFCVSPACHK